MKAVLVLTIAAGALIAQLQNAKEVSVDLAGKPGAIHLKGTLAQDGKGVRLDAVAVNNSGETIDAIKLCVVADTPKKTPCLFTLWNTEPWEPGAELSWDLKSKLDLPDLWFDVKESLTTPAKPSQPIPGPPSSTAGADQEKQIVKGGKIAHLYNLRTAEVLTAHFTKGWFIGGHGKISAIRESGDVLTGEYSTVPKGSVGFGSIISSVTAAGGYATGSGFGTVAAVDARQNGQAIIAGQGIVIECEYVASGLTAHGYGACKQNDGTLFRLIF